MAIRVFRRLTHGLRPDHLVRTAREPREEVTVQATVVGVRTLTPTVKELELLLPRNSGFRFQAGNWVDFFIDQDGVDKVGGYSMCSIPRDLPKLRLAVKASRHPPAAWCHEHAAPGKVVHVKAGGSFFFDARQSEHLENLVLVAGGIGINPLYSILQEALNEGSKLRMVSLLYSASTPSELAYADELKELELQDPRLRVQLSVTRNLGPSAEPWDGQVERISAESIRAAVLAGGLDSSLVYVCGPPSMTDQLVHELTEGFSLSHEKILYEKWW